MWNWLKAIFKKKQAPVKTEPPVIIVSPSDPIPEIPNKEEVESFPSMKSKYQNIAIIIGHGHGDSGAESWDKKRNEFQYNSIVAEYLKKNLPKKNIKLFWRGKSGISGVNGSVALWDDDLSLELHLNSADNPNAKGCEILCLGSDKDAVKLGQDLATKFCAHFGRVKRDDDGVKELKKGDRGHYSLALVDDGKPSILLEPFFISNKNEWVDPIIYADFLTRWISEL